MAERIAETTVGLTIDEAQLRASIAKARTALESGLPDIRLRGIDTSGLTRGISDTKKQFNQLTEASVDFGDSLERGLRRIVALSAASAGLFGLTSAFREALKSSIEVEKSLQNINAFAGLPTTKLQDFGRQLFDIARGTKQAFSEAADAALELSRQGLGVEESLKRTYAALLLVNLAGINAADATKTLTSAINSFSNENLDALEVVNKLVAVDSRFAVSTSDLANALTRVGSTAQDVGVGFDRLIAVTTAAQQVTQRGGAVIGNALRSIFTRLERRDTLDQLEELGIQTREVSAETGKYTGSLIPADRVLAQIAEKFKTLNQEQKANVTQLVAGNYQGNIFRGILDGLTQSQEAYRVSVSATDEAIRRNNLLLETQAAKLSQAGTTLQQIGANFGQIGFGNTTKNFLDTFNNNIITKSLAGTAGDLGNEFGKVFIKSVSDIIISVGGPAILGLGIKVLQTLKGFGANLIKQINPFGDNSAVLNSQQQITRILETQKREIVDIVRTSDTRIQREERLLALLQGQTAAIAEQKLATSIASEIFARKGGSLTFNPRTLVKASASIPNYAYGTGVDDAIEREENAVSKGVGGASPSARAVYLPYFDAGAPKGIVANTDEYIVPNFGQNGKPAIFNKDMVRQLGLPDGAQRISANLGLVNNYAAGVQDIPELLGRLGNVKFVRQQEALKLFKAEEPLQSGKVEGTLRYLNEEGITKGSLDYTHKNNIAVIDYLSSKQRGLGTALFKELAGQFSEIKSPVLLPQQKKLEKLIEQNPNATHAETIKAAFPQLAYRTKVNAITSGVVSYQASKDSPYEEKKFSSLRELNSVLKTRKPSESDLFGLSSLVTRILPPGSNEQSDLGFKFGARGYVPNHASRSSFRVPENTGTLSLYEPGVHSAFRTTLGGFFERKGLKAAQLELDNLQERRVPITELFSIAKKYLPKNESRNLIRSFVRTGEGIPPSTTGFGGYIPSYAGGTTLAELQYRLFDKVLKPKISKAEIYSTVGPDSYRKLLRFASRDQLEAIGTKADTDSKVFYDRLRDVFGISGKIPNLAKGDVRLSGTGFQIQGDDGEFGRAIPKYLKDIIHDFGKEQTTNLFRRISEIDPQRYKPKKLAALLTQTVEEIGRRPPQQIEDDEGNIIPQPPIRVLPKTKYPSAPPSIAPVGTPAPAQTGFADIAERNLRLFAGKVGDQITLPSERYILPTPGQLGIPSIPSIHPQDRAVISSIPRDIPVTPGQPFPLRRPLSFIPPISGVGFPTARFAETPEDIAYKNELLNSRSGFLPERNGIPRLVSALNRGARPGTTAATGAITRAIEKSAESAENTADEIRKANVALINKRIEEIENETKGGPVRSSIRSLRTGSLKFARSGFGQGLSRFGQSASSLGAFIGTPLAIEGISALTQSAVAGNDEFKRERIAGAFSGIAQGIGIFQTGASISSALGPGAPVGIALSALAGGAIAANSALKLFGESAEESAKKAEQAQKASENRLQDVNAARAGTARIQDLIEGGGTPEAIASASKAALAAARNVSDVGLREALKKQIFTGDFGNETTANVNKNFERVQRQEVRDITLNPARVNQLFGEAFSSGIGGENLNALRGFSREKFNVEGNGKQAAENAKNLAASISKLTPTLRRDEGSVTGTIKQAFEDLGIGALTRTRIGGFSLSEYTATTNAENGDILSKQRQTQAQNVRSIFSQIGVNTQNGGEIDRAIQAIGSAGTGTEEYNKSISKIRDFLEKYGVSLKDTAKETDENAKVEAANKIIVERRINVLRESLVSEAQSLQANAERQNRAAQRVSGQQRGIDVLTLSGASGAEIQLQSFKNSISNIESGVTDSISELGDETRKKALALLRDNEKVVADQLKGAPEFNKKIAEITNAKGPEELNKSLFGLFKVLTDANNKSDIRNLGKQFGEVGASAVLAAEKLRSQGNLQTQDLRRERQRTELFNTPLPFTAEGAGIRGAIAAAKTANVDINGLEFDPRQRIQTSTTGIDVLKQIKDFAVNAGVTGERNPVTGRTSVDSITNRISELQGKIATDSAKVLKEDFGEIAEKFPPEVASAIRDILKARTEKAELQKEITDNPELIKKIQEEAAARQKPALNDQELIDAIRAIKTLQSQAAFSGLGNADLSNGGTFVGPKAEEFIGNVVANLPRENVTTEIPKIQNSEALVNALTALGNGIPLNFGGEPVKVSNDVTVKISINDESIKSIKADLQDGLQALFEEKINNLQYKLDVITKQGEFSIPPRIQGVESVT